MTQVSLDNAQVIVLVELEGQIHLVAMQPDALQVCDLFIKNCIDTIVRTNVTHKELVEKLKSIPAFPNCKK